MVALHCLPMMSRSRSESLRSIITRKASGILRSPAPPISSIELSPIAGIDPVHPTSILSYRCECGYLKNHIMCLGDLVDKEQRLFNFCGGMFVVKGEQAECSRCRKTDRTVVYTCSFCGKETDIVVAVVSMMWSRVGSRFDLHPRASLEDITEERVIFHME